MNVRPLVVVRASAIERWRDLAIVSALALWLVYTRVYWALSAAHATLPPCPFYYLTGHPCPFCGGTRSFAYMWRGDFGDALRLYPLGPAMFAATVVGAGGLLAGAVTGRTWSVALSRIQWRAIVGGAVTVLAISWALKVFVLGN